MSPRPPDPPMGTCDWGRCNREAIAWRYDANLKIWLPVCPTHRDSDD